MKIAEAFAPAKINLALHVTGQRADGYHLLDSLVMLADVGDRITVRDTGRLSLRVTGPMAKGVPTDASNLVMKAAALIGVDAEITLEKNLPPASGIGGGSSDAAATLRALARLSGRPLPGGDALLRLGADVPVCMMNALTRMQGIGGEIEVLGDAPDLPLLLVNPLVEVATADVFSRLSHKDNPPMVFPMPDAASDLAGWAQWLARQRNDLEAPAMAAAPVIGTVLDTLGRFDGAVLARMSGSGASCFAIMRDRESRDRAVAVLRQDYPGWWVAPAGPCAAVFS